MLNAYSRRKDGNALLSRSFRVREFACRDGSDPLFVDSALVQLLQDMKVANHRIADLEHNEKVRN